MSQYICTFTHIHIGHTFIIVKCIVTFSRLYETQVKKIVKVQSMMRAFLAKRNVAGKLLKQRQDSIKKEASRQNSEQKSETEEGGGE